MTAATGTPARGATTPATPGGASPFAGFGPLLRLALRRDRIKLTSWILGISLFTAYFANALQIAYPEQSDLEAVMGFMDSPAGVMMTGPGFGFDDPTHATVFAGAYGIWLMIAAAFMSILLVARHTRSEEEAGRLELVRAAPVGRHAPLAVAATLVVLAAAVLFGLCWALVAVPHGSAGAALFAGSLAMVGLVFGGVALVTAQLVEHSRSATGLAALVVGAAIVVRGAGDTLAEGGSWLSWLSPIGWAQQTRVFFDGRWWPLALGVLLAVGCYAVAGVLQARRDVGAGILATRAGRPRATAALGSPLGLAWRLERGSIIAWASAVGAMGLMYGSLTGSVESSLAGVDNEILIQAMGGDPSRLVDGYLATSAYFDAFLVACFVIVSLHRLTKEEVEGRTEAILATSASRTSWLLACLVTALAGAAAVLVAGGLGLAVSAAATTGEWSYAGSVLGAHLLYLPAIALFAAVGVAGYSVRPALLNLAWLAAVYAGVLGYLGVVLDLPRAALDLSAFEHVAMAPLEEQPLLPLAALTALAVVLIGVGLAQFRRRDLHSV